MNSELDPYRVWLGLKLPIKPSFYELIGLDEFTSDPEQIRAAADRAAARVRGCKPGEHAQQWSTVLDEIRNAKTCLLDEKCRTKYDAELRQRKPKTDDRSPVIISKGPRICTDPNLFPPGMGPAEAPAKGGDEAVRLAHASNSNRVSSDERRTPTKVGGDAMRAVNPKPDVKPQVPPAVTPTAISPAMQPYVPNVNAPLPGVTPPETTSLAAGVPNPQDPMRPFPLVSGSHSPIFQPNIPVNPHSSILPNVVAWSSVPTVSELHPSGLENASSPTPKVKSLVRATEQRRKSRKLKVGALVALCVALVVPVILISLKPDLLDQIRIATTGAEDRESQVTYAPGVNAKSALKERKAVSEKTENDSTIVPTPPGPALPEPNVPSNVNNPAQGTGANQDAKTEKPVGEVSNDPVPNVKVPEAKSEPVKSVPTPMPATTTPVETPKPSAAELKELSTALTGARRSVGEQEFAIAESFLSKAEAVAKLPVHQAQVERLRAIAAYVKQFSEAVVAAVKALNAGDSIKVGNSTIVAFVEARPDAVVLRVTGMNRTFKLNKLPAGLAIAIAETHLAEKDPATLLIKGAYLLTNPNSNEEAIAKARRYFETAAAAGAQIDDLLAIFDDKYDTAVEE